MNAKKIHDNPTADELRAFTEEMPACRVTEFDNVNVQTRVIVAFDRVHLRRDRGSRRHQPEGHDPRGVRSHRDDAGRVHRPAGDGGDRRLHRQRRELPHAGTTLHRARQRQHRRDAAEAVLRRSDGAEPEVQVIYTPNLAAPGYPDERVIAVDLEHSVTRVIGSDYFGESKKGGLRMWNTIVYDRGGLALHAGCKSIPVNGEEKVFLIIGLSGTGKTTTTFTTQNDSLPVQDDFVALMPGGKVYGTENGCFAKTFSLDPDFEPNIFNAVVKPTSYLENVYQDADGQGELLRDLLHAERARRVRHERPRPVRGRARPGQRGLPADPQPEREHHPRGRAADAGAGRRVLHARRDDGHIGGRRRRGGQVPPGSRGPIRSSRSPTDCRATGSSSCSTRTRWRST